MTESRLRSMEVEDAVRRLRVVRRFRPEPLVEEDVHAILEAARRTGSSKNLQRWHFIVVRDRALLARLADVGPFAAHLYGGGTAVAMITPDPAAADSPHSVMWDLGRAAQNMILVAFARGIGSVPATVYEQQLCRDLLGYPADRHCEYILNFGYPASNESMHRPLRAGGRKPLGELVFYERWGVQVANDSVEGPQSTT